jgi:CheY-like chemotaxis protein
LLDVRSAAGEGTRFTIYLPLAERPATVEVVESEQNTVAQGETILLAEDDGALRELAVLTLEELGYTVLAAADGFEALELEAEHDGPIHLLLSDVVMPVIGGFDLVHAIHKTRPDTKALLMSGYPARGEYDGRARPEGVPLLQKPLTPEDLALAIRNALDGKESVAA